MNNTTMSAVKRVEFCRFQQKISKGGSFQTINKDKESKCCVAE
jgi:hypothetical protein